MKTNRWGTVWLLAGLLAAALAAGAAPNPVRVLVITGGHGFEKEPFFKLFENNKSITWKTAAHPAAHALLKAEAARDYDVLVLYDMWQKITDEAKADFLARLKEGKGLVALHHSLASYQDWPEYAEIIGGKYHLKKSVEGGRERPASTYKHDVDLKIAVANNGHPIIQGLKDFEIHDEAYGGFEVREGVTPLLTTDHPESSKTVAWAKTHGPARVATIQLGHDHKAYENPHFQKLLAQAIQWVADKP